MKRLAGILALLVGSLVLTYVTRGGHGGYDFERDADSVLSTIVPAGALKTHETPTDRDAVGFWRGCRFVVDMSWDAYTRWVTSRLSTRFSRAERSAAVARYVEYTDGDVYAVLLEVVEPGPPLEVRARYSAGAH